MLKIVRTPAAASDLAAIADFIATDNLTAALGFYDEIDHLLSVIAEYPEIGEAVAHLSPGLRRFTLGNYLLFYLHIGEEIVLIRVLHGARDIDRLM